MLQLKNLRINKNATQKQVAEYLGVSRPTYTRYENGEREPSLQTLINLSKFFNVSIDELIINNSNRKTNNETTLNFNLEGLDIDIYECSHLLCDEDKINVLRYIDFIKKRKEFI